MYTLLHELRHTGAQTPALAMLVEPLLPRAWRKELEKQKVLKDDADTELYATGIAEQDIAHPYRMTSLLWTALRCPSRCRKFLMLWILFL